LDTLLTAYAALTADWPHALVLAGKKGWYTDALFTQVKQQGLEERVHFTDYIPDEELPGLYNLAEVFAFPSRYEGFGLPPLEAMACGVPVVSSNAASLPEVIGDAGLLVPPDDPDALAAALRRVLSDADLRAELRARGWRQAARFTWDETARRTLAVYESVLHAPVS
jgi:glycosyltransferase involved in cell wall biosynthesis